MLRLAFREPRAPLRSVCVAEISDATPRFSGTANSASLRLRSGNIRCYASHISFIIPLPYKIGKNGNVNFNFLRGRLTNEQTSISLLRIHRMVSGNTLDGTSFPASGRCCHERHHIPSYVPHLRLCGADHPCLPQDQKSSHFSSRMPVYCRFLLRGIYQRLYFAGFSHVPLGLFRCSSPVPGNHPSGLSSRVVSHRIIF